MLSICVVLASELGESPDPKLQRFGQQAQPANIQLRPGRLPPLYDSGDAQTPEDRDVHVARAPERGLGWVRRADREELTVALHDEVGGRDDVPAKGEGQRVQELQEITKLTGREVYVQPSGISDVFLNRLIKNLIFSVLRL